MVETLINRQARHLSLVLRDFLELAGRFPRRQVLRHRLLQKTINNDNKNR